MRFCSFLGPAPVQEGIEGPDESRTVPRGEGPSDSQVVFSLVFSWFFAILNISPQVALINYLCANAQIQSISRKSFLTSFFYLEIEREPVSLKISFTPVPESTQYSTKGNRYHTNRVSFQIPSKRSGWCRLTLSLTIIMSLPKKKKERKKKKKRRIKEEKQIFDHLDARIWQRTTTARAIVQWRTQSEKIIERRKYTGWEPPDDSQGFGYVRNTCSLERSRSPL